MPRPVRTAGFQSFRRLESQKSAGCFETLKDQNEASAMQTIKSTTILLMLSAKKE